MAYNYPQQLPIVARKDDIIQAIRQHQIIVIAGDTGSGKTTQLPKMCLEAGQGKKGIIGCTQPRRIAAVSVAERVEQEMAAPGLVGYKIRFHDHTRPETKIKFMTDGILLAETRGDRRLSRYDTIIIDEAHERSLNIDFLLGCLHQLLKERRDLKMIISSATIDTEKFSHHFADAPIIEVSGRTYPVNFHYLLDLPEKSEKRDSDKNFVELAVDQVVELADNPGGGDILVFMPTERDILDTVRLLGKKLFNPAQVLPLFGRLQGAEQRRIFQQSGLRKIIVATNVAETSITVPGIRTVVDTGVARIARYNVRAGTTSLPVTRVSRASCDQRAGRCGRTGPGTCYRLYSEEDYLSRSEFTLPEILRSNLAEVILQMISLGLGDPRKFPFLEPPAPRAINDGYRILRELGATTPDNRLTSRGRIMATLPLDPRISRMIIEGAELGVLREVTIIAAVLAIQDPRTRPLDKAEQARQAQSEFIQPGSDFLTFVHIWDSCKQAMQGNHPSAGLRKFCKKYYISWQRMREWFDIHDQLERIIKQHKEITGKKAQDRKGAKNQQKNNSKAADSKKSVSSAAVHQALTAGFLRNIGMRKQKNSYQISGNREVVLFPGSGLYNRGGQWIVAADFIHTSQLFARVVANIEVSWLERLGGDLCKRSWSDPHWQKKAGQVMALEKVSLFGLLLVAGRRVNYGRINTTTGQEAREIFIREALIAGQLTGNYPFLQHNLDLSQRFSEMEDRLRKRSIVTDDQVLYDFYDQRLGQVYDRFTLNRFLSRKEHKSNKKFLWMKEEDVCQLVPDSDELYRFPKTLETSQGALRLHYCFQPGHEEDGITVDIPVSCYPALLPDRFEWLVPGLLDEKIFFLLKGLPKRLRRLFVPLPDAVDRIMDGMENRKGSLYPTLEQIILRCFQVTIVRSDWQLENMPAHLRMRYRICDENGKTLYCSRNFQQLAQYCVQPAQPAVASKGTTGRKAEKAAPVNEKGKRIEECREIPGITSWDFVSPLEPVPVLDRKNRIIGMQYPALKIVDAGHERSLTLYYTADFNQACAANRDGLRFLYALQFSREIKAVKKECKAAVAGHTASWMSLGLRATAAELKTMLFQAVLDSLFTISQPLAALPTKEEVDTAVAALQEQGISREARIILTRVLDLLAVRRQTRSVLTRSRQRAAKSRSLAVDRYEEYQQLLDQLLPSDFLTSGLSSEQLLDTKRYLQALASRIERAEHAPHKDRRKAERIQPVLEQMQQLDRQLKKMKETGQSRSLPCLEEIARFRRMVEEYRIAVFAPEIGTALPVSEKRIACQWQKISNSCHSME